MQFLHEGLDYYLNPAVAKELQKRYLIKSLKVSLFRKGAFTYDVRFVGKYVGQASSDFTK